MERLLVLALVFGGIVIAGYVVREMARRKREQVIASLKLEPEAAGQPRILSFYGPACDACDRQKVVLHELEHAYPNRFSLELRDASTDYGYAQQFGLVIVPTTVVIAANGAINAINSGFASRTKLEEQLDAA
jgi:thioredoxin-like negative regulator of GroEL